MQPQFNRNQRERPLQKSMFLQSEQYGNRSSNDYQYQQLTTMKRSAIGVQNTQSPNFVHNINQVNMNNNPNFPPNHQALNFSTTPRHRDAPQKMSVTNIPSFHNQNQSNPIDLAQKLQRLTKIVERHDLMLSKQKRSDSPMKSKLLTQDQMQQLQANIRDKILPSLLNKQIYQNMFHFKMDIQGLKDEVSKIQKIADKNKIDLQCKFKQMTIATKNPNGINTDKSIYAKIDETDISTRLLALQNTIYQKNDSLKKIIIEQMQKNKNLKFSPQKTLKISGIKSSLSPIMLEYQQLFYVKHANTSGKLSLRKQQEILINSCTYYIDKQGYLLDNLNRYIVDAKGMQVKLQEKHLIALKNHHILN